MTLRSLLALGLTSFLLLPVVIATAQTCPGSPVGLSCVGSGATIQINQHGVCRQVTNSNGATMMLSHNSAAEWASFYNNGVPGVTFGTCVAACTPTREFHRREVCGWEDYGAGGQDWVCRQEIMFYNSENRFVGKCLLASGAFVTDDGAYCHLVNTLTKLTTEPTYLACS